MGAEIGLGLLAYRLTAVTTVRKIRPDASTEWLTPDRLL
jgi:hypothetical protein